MLRPTKTWMLPLIATLILSGCASTTQPRPAPICPAPPKLPQPPAELLQAPAKLQALPEGADSAQALAVITGNYAAAGENAAALVGWQAWWRAVVGEPSRNP